jgi:hypothetical protein
MGEDSRNSKEGGKVKRERARQIILAIVGLLYVALLYPLYTDLAHSSWLVAQMSDCTQIPEFRISISFSALKSRNSRHFMYSNPGRKNLPRNGEDREGLRSC